jgi:hypothetical protein
MPAKPRTFPAEVESLGFVPIPGWRGQPENSGLQAACKMAPLEYWHMMIV